MSLLSRRQKAEEALLDFFADLTQLPMILYEQRDGDLVGVYSRKASLLFEDHCKFLHSLPGGKRLCEADHCGRANLSTASEEHGSTLCHAGLYNVALPVRLRGEVKAVLLCGQMQRSDPASQKAMLAQHRKLVERLGLSKDAADKLRKLQLATKQETQAIQEMAANFESIEKWFRALLREEERMTKMVERIQHEFQTRLQAVLALSENLVEEVASLNQEEASQRAFEILKSALALDTVVQNMGESFEDYSFERTALGPALKQARDIYRAEAERRFVDVGIHLAPVKGQPPVVEASWHHLEYAFNNLVHNAIKYSFKGGAKRFRFVWINGKALKDCYQISLENYGVGILPAEIQDEKLFEDGYQGQLTEGEFRTGSGKGLHFVKKVIDRHGGQIAFESKALEHRRTSRGVVPYLTKVRIRLPYKQNAGAI